MGEKPQITIDQANNSLGLLRAVVNQTVKLVGDYGRCPFHNEKTSSFHIYQKSPTDRARFHCFGCGARGDVFNFVQKIDNISFGQAKAKLEQMLGREICPSFLPGAPENSLQNAKGLLDSSRPNPARFCEKDCPKYAALREDYDVILEQMHQGIQLCDTSDRTITQLVDTIINLRSEIELLEKKLRPSKFGRRIAP